MAEDTSNRAKDLAAKIKEAQEMTAKASAVVSEAAIYWNEAAVLASQFDEPAKAVALSTFAGQAANAAADLARLTSDGKLAAKLSEMTDTFKTHMTETDAP